MNLDAVLAQIKSDSETWDRFEVSAESAIILVKYIELLKQEVGQLKKQVEDLEEYKFMYEGLCK
jgi:hypothetical protein